MPDVKYIIVHHTGAEEKDADQVRRYHLSLGWRDVGYHCLIERNGAVVAGRPLHLDGAHCTAANMNRQSIGVAVIGNLEQRIATAEQSVALESLLRRLTTLYHIPPRCVLGHREVSGAATACPGGHLDLDRLRRAIGPIPGSMDQSKQAENANVAPQNLWRVQAGAFSTRQAAEARAQKLRELGLEALVVPAPAE